MSYCLNFRIGGAWGHHFFECDHDQDIVSQISADMGICKYNPSPQMQSSLLNPHHRAYIVEKVLPTEVDRVFEKYLAILQNHTILDIPTTRRTSSLIDSPRYYIFVLGLLAMQLGHPVSSQHRRWMADNLHGCFFNEERVEQGKMAVGFSNAKGEVLQLGSMTLNQRIVGLANGGGVSWGGSFTEANRAVIVEPALLEVEMAVRRMEADNEVAKLKGGSEEKGVDISAPVDISALVDVSAGGKVVVGRLGGTEREVGRVDMAPERELGNWIAYRDEKGLEKDDEHKKYGWTRNEGREREVRRVLRELLRSGVLLN